MSVVRRSTLAATAALLLVLGTAAVAAATAAPTGTFTLNRTSAYLYDNPLADYSYANFLVHRVSLADDTTPTAEIVVTVDPDDGSQPETWDFDAPEGSDDFAISYDHLGTFHPTVTLTDADAGTTTIELGAVTVLQDRYPPTFTLTKPRHVHRTGAWHRMVGTYSDVGVGLDGITLRVLQKRHGYWYAFSACCAPHAYRWVRGKKTLAATLAMRRYGSIDGLATGPHRWRSHWISHLTRGLLVVVAFADDNNVNFSAAKTYSVRLTRR